MWTEGPTTSQRTLKPSVKVCLMTPKCIWFYFAAQAEVIHIVCRISFCSRLPCVLVLEYLQQDRGVFCILTAGPISCIFRWHKVSCAIMCIEISFLGWCWGFTLCLCPLPFWSINPFGLQRPPHCHVHVASSLWFATGFVKRHPVCFIYPDAGPLSTRRYALVSQIGPV